jgi:hypothetical protein
VALCGIFIPMRSLATAGFGIAFLSFGLPAFCYPVDVPMADFGAHISLVALILGLLTVVFGRRAVAVRPLG